jgi:tRNA:m4X modification enzyme
MLERHILICPQRKKQKLLQDAPYYVENVNLGGFGDVRVVDGDEESPPANDNTAICQMTWAQSLARRVLQVHQVVFAQKSIDNVATLTWEDIHDALPLVDRSKAELDAGMEHGFQSHHIKSGGARHIPQLASLIGHLRAMRVFENDHSTKQDSSSSATIPEDRPPTQDSTTTASTISESPLVLMDMGAGRGMLGLAAAGVATAANSSRPKVHLIMVERTGSRSKAEKAFRNIPKDADTSYLHLENVQWSRCACDLAHVHLPVLVDQHHPNAKIVVVAKHLCGVGTDLALKSLASIRGRVDACVFATCCHGVCDWNHYVGRDYLRRVMESCDGVSFGAAEFDLLRRWCAAAVSSAHDNDATQSPHNDTDGGQNHVPTVQTNKNIPKSISSEHNNAVDSTNSSQITSIASIVRDLDLTCGIQGLGRACKQLIDFGRYKYLRKQIFTDDEESSNVKLFHYISPTVSPENTAFSGCKKYGD